jgi:hypothetical protein
MSKPTATASAAPEINRLHEEVQRLTLDSKQGLLGAMAAAWQAGHLLIAEKKRVWATMGRGSWLLWLEQCFHGTPRTAQNYMRLAQTVADVSAMQGMSLRQIYFRLGVPTEPKSRVESVRVPPLPPHIRLANKLVVELRPCLSGHRSSVEQWESYRRDLRQLYEQLRRLFESEPTANIPKNVGIIQENSRSR